MEKVSLHGITVKYFKVIGKMARKTDMEYGNLPKETIIKVNGLTIGKMAMESIII